MNGRVYDPKIGRFMSPDPFVQAPQDVRSFNRYAYVLNNPLSLTDPSGFFFGDESKFAAVPVAVTTARVAVALAASLTPVGWAVVGVVTVTAVACAAYCDDVYDYLTDGPVDGTQESELPEGPVNETEENEGEPDFEEGSPPTEAAHRKGIRKSTQYKHQQGEAREDQDYGGEKGDKKRRPPRKRPDDHRGSWPPKKPPKEPPEADNPEDEDPKKD